MHDNDGIDLRCRTLWSQVVSALETRVTSVNRYVPEAKSRLACEQLSSEAVQLQHASANRRLIASLDLESHAIHVNRFDGIAEGQGDSEQGLPLSLLGDGEVYVTEGNQLLADPVEVAKFLVTSLLGRSAPAVA